jgi:hypothetical protein
MQIVSRRVMPFERPDRASGLASRSRMLWFCLQWDSWALAWRSKPLQSAAWCSRATRQWCCVKAGYTWESDSCQAYQEASACVISSSPEPGAGFCREPDGFTPRPHAVLKIRFNSILPSDLSLKVSQIKACVFYVWPARATWFAHVILLHFIAVIKLPKVSEVKFFIPVTWFVHMFWEPPF